MTKESSSVVDWFSVAFCVSKKSASKYRDHGSVWVNCKDENLAIEGSHTKWQNLPEIDHNGVECLFMTEWTEGWKSLCDLHDWFQYGKTANKRATAI